METAISIKNLSKDYRRLRAIEDVSLEVEAGEFFGFLGPNGAGKTTTISVLTGLANFSAGQVRVFGHDVLTEYRKTRALIGLVPQEFNFDPFLTAKQILTYEAGYFGVPKRQAKERAEELLGFFKLTEKSNDGYKKLSGGMKRRLLIARALVHRPKILILDEPTAGVDLELRYQLWDFLRGLNKEGTTIFLTTHYIEEAEKLCSRIGVIHRGKIVALEPTEALVRRMSGDQVELYLKKEMLSVPEDVEAIPIVLEDKGRKLRFEERDNAVAKVLKSLHNHGYEIDRIDIRRPTLEDAFLRLIRDPKEKAAP
ncbi:MAG: ABC transporter ATP-binding protein [Candidatus Omnitrophota bacterium]|nr:ABC transporter ATP-binding protein [Candidatus Omnitrophota bacterium]